jgi:hypothetical protein
VLVAIMVDRTTYPDDQVPELALRQVFGRQRLPENLCLLAAEVGLRTMDTFAMLGDNITGVKQTLNRIVPDPARFGADAAAQELALTNLTAVWKTCSTLQEHFASRRAKMEEDPFRRYPKFRVRIMQSSASSSCTNTQMCCCRPTGNPTGSWSNASNVITLFMVL